MSKQMVTLSDLTSTIVPNGQRVRMVVEHHPVLENEQVELDASLAEIASLLESTGQYIVIKFHLPDGEVRSNVVEVQVFDAAFKGDPYAVLKDATRVSNRPTSTSTKRSKEDLDKIRTWARAHGWPELKDRGRIPQEIEDAYSAANPAA